MSDQTTMMGSGRDIAGAQPPAAGQPGAAGQPPAGRQPPAAGQPPTASQTKTAWLYAGQGSQYVGMGADFYAEYPEVRQFFQSQAAGFDIAKLCFASPAENLTDTRHAQACIAAFSAAVSALLEKYLPLPDYAAGLSLGEYCALYQAGVFTFEQLLSLLAFRGRAMAAAAEGIDCRMSAILGLTDAEVEAVVSETQAAGAAGAVAGDAARSAADAGTVVAATEAKAADAMESGESAAASAVYCSNYNCPGQVVIAGAEQAVQPKLWP